jgi:hypothetical protein
VPAKPICVIDAKSAVSVVVKTVTKSKPSEDEEYVKLVPLFTIFSHAGLYEAPAPPVPLV